MPRSTVLLIDDDALRSHARMDALQHEFHAVRRCASAAEAFILLEQADVADAVALAIVALRRPGLSRPEFVRELAARLPGRTVVVLGGLAEVEREYSGEHVRFLQPGTPMREMLRAVRMGLGGALSEAA